MRERPRELLVHPLEHELHLLALPARVRAPLPPRALLGAVFRPHTPLAACSYVVTKGEDVRCVFPSGVKDANDPACILRIDETNGTVTRPAQPNLLYDKINQARSLWGRWVGDVARSWWVVALCGVGLALFFGLVYLLLLRCVGGAAAWRGRAGREPLRPGERGPGRP